MTMRVPGPRSWSGCLPSQLQAGQRSGLPFFFFLIILFIFGCAESPLPWGGYSLVVVHGLLTAVVSLVAHGL